MENMKAANNSLRDDSQIIHDATTVTPAKMTYRRKMLLKGSRGGPGSDAGGDLGKIKLPGWCDETGEWNTGDRIFVKLVVLKLCSLCEWLSSSKREIVRLQVLMMSTRYVETRSLTPFAQFEAQAGKTFQDKLAKVLFGSWLVKISGDAMQRCGESSVLVQWKSFLVCVSINLVLGI
ncbi:hypothetical protein HAX54_046068 [Datura stramonium]|uniref:Uncharacterized protein n=1 Tax=Datura stramonium TaxID=4076 RepID=A0ABS8SQW6_DATST|nr:hypothetical protein [Datura stramonium]